MESETLKHILEASLLVAGRALSLSQIDVLFEDDGDKPDRAAIREALTSLQADYEGRGIELVEVASGFRLQSRAAMEPWISRLFPERAPRYSRALLETLVLIAYRQPITRGEIEEVRGVAVSSTIIKTLQEREWIKVIGHKEVPGRPALLATTRSFLDYFNLKRLEDLPPLSELKNLDQIDARLAEEIGLVTPEMQGAAANDEVELHGPPAPSTVAENGTPGEGSAGSASAEIDSTPPVAGDDARQPADPLPAGRDATAASENGQTAGQPVSEPVSQAAGTETHTGTSVASVEDQPAPASQAQTELQRVIANFAMEHRQQLEAQRAASDRRSDPSSSESPSPVPDGSEAGEPELSAGGLSGTEPAEAEQAEAEQAETEQSEAEQSEAEQAETEQAETEQAEAEQAEAEQAEAEQVEAEQAEAEQAEAEQAEAEQVETEQVETEQVDAEQARPTEPAPSEAAGSSDAAFQGAGSPHQPRQDDSNDQSGGHAGAHTGDDADARVDEPADVTDTDRLSSSANEHYSQDSPGTGDSLP